MSCEVQADVKKNKRKFILLTNKAALKLVCSVWSGFITAAIEAVKVRKFPPNYLTFTLYFGQRSNESSS